MANMIMASSKTLIPSSSYSSPFLPPKPRLQLPQISLPKFPKTQLKSLTNSTSLKSMTAIIAASLAAAPPSLAEVIEKAALFDFDLTLPIMMAEISAALNKMKKETTMEVEQKLAEERKKLEAELQEALASLEKQKEETIKSLDSQIAALSDEIVKKVLPI
ncbi:hypothetical protein CsSME_00049027 [Camellia sinensis var. sinensis]